MINLYKNQEHMGDAKPAASNMLMRTENLNLCNTFRGTPGYVHAYYVHNPTPSCAIATHRHATEGGRPAGRAERVVLE